jgi:hypothetical protein
VYIFVAIELEVLNQDCDVSKPLSHNELEFVTSSVTFALASAVAKSFRDPELSVKYFSASNDEVKAAYVFVAKELEVLNQDCDASTPRAISFFRL